MTKKCYLCGSDTARREVTWTVNAGGHDVTHQLTEDVCTACGEWSISAPELGRLELISALQALTSHPITGALAKFTRKALGLKQTELGERLGVAWETVSRWEREERPMERWVALSLQGLLYAKLRDVGGLKLAS